MRIKSIQDYHDAPEIELPYAAKTMPGKELFFTPLCGGCGRPCARLKGWIFEIGKTIEVEGAGSCYRCNIVTAFRFRWNTKTDEYFLLKKKTGWRRIKGRSSASITVRFKWALHRLKTIFQEGR